MTIMGRVTNQGTAEQITKEFIRDVAEQVSEFDWTMEGLKAFAEYALPHIQKGTKGFTCQSITDWCVGHEEFKDNLFLNNSRKLARYMKSHSTMIEKATGVYNTGTKTANREVYSVKYK